MFITHFFLKTPFFPEHNYGSFPRKLRIDRLQHQNCHFICTGRRVNNDLHEEKANYHLSGKRYKYRIILTVIFWVHMYNLAASHLFFLKVHCISGPIPVFCFIYFFLYFFIFFGLSGINFIKASGVRVRVRVRVGSRVNISFAIYS